MVTADDRRMYNDNVVGDDGTFDDVIHDEDDGDGDGAMMTIRWLMCGL